MITPTSPIIGDDTNGLETMQTAGPNPDPFPIPLQNENEHQAEDENERAKECNPTGHASEGDNVSATDPTKVKPAELGPPPDGGREAWLVVLGGFFLMYTSFGFSECIHFCAPIFSGCVWQNGY